jgi:hypothetical protein
MNASYVTVSGNGTSMAVAIFRENHAMSARSRTLSSYRTFAVAFPQSSGNSAVARLKNEYGSVNPARGGSIEPAPEDEEARASTPRRACDAVVGESRHVARDADVSRADAWRAGSREEEAAARAGEPIRREVPRASRQAPRRAGTAGDEVIADVMLDRARGSGGHVTWHR